jgi:hypothetical protein
MLSAFRVNVRTHTIPGSQSNEWILGLTVEVLLTRTTKMTEDLQTDLGHANLMLREAGMRRSAVLVVLNKRDDQLVEVMKMKVVVKRDGQVIAVVIGPSPMNSLPLELLKAYLHLCDP